MEIFKSLGHEVIELSDTEARKWEGTIAPVFDNYIDKMNKKGKRGKRRGKEEREGGREGKV